MAVWSAFSQTDNYLWVYQDGSWGAGAWAGPALWGNATISNVTPEWNGSGEITSISVNTSEGTCYFNGSSWETSMIPVPSDYTIDGTKNSPTGANAVAWENSAGSNGLVYVCTNGIWETVPLGGSGLWSPTFEVKGISPYWNPTTGELQAMAVWGSNNQLGYYQLGDYLWVYQDGSWGPRAWAGPDQWGNATISNVTPEWNGSGEIASINVDTNLAIWEFNGTIWDDSVITEISQDPSNINNAVYQITIPCMSLNYGDMFTTGYNGFFYNIAITNNNTTTNLTEYPLTGFNMNGDSSSNFVISTKPETFQFIGPQYTAGIGTAPQVTVSLEGYNLNSSNQSTVPAIISSFTSSLPAFSQDTTDYSNYNITITPLSGNDIENIGDGTCAVPFDVEIENSTNSQVVPDSSPLYNNLIFSYIQSGTTSSAEGSIIGADISSPQEGYFGIIPASLMEDSNGNVQYGIDGNTLYNNVGNGHIYYLLCGPNAENGSTIQAELCGESNATASITVNLISNNQSNFTVMAANSGLNQTLTLQGPDFNGSETYPSSDIYGYTDGSATQYIIPNYVYSNTDSMPGIYVLPEEGLNTQTLQNRFNWSKLNAGYRILPYDINGISETNPLDDSGFIWQYAAQQPVTVDGITQTTTFSITNFNPSMAGNTLYDYLISAYGTIHPYSYTDSNALITTTPAQNTCSSSNSTDMPVYVTQSSGAVCGIPFNNYGLFMPPNSTVSVYEGENFVGGQTFNSYYWSDNNIPVMSL